MNQVVVVGRPEAGLVYEFADRHHRHAQATLLPLVPRRTDAYPGMA